MQALIGADRDVGALHVVVDGADQPDDGEMRMRGSLVAVDLALCMQLVEHARPLGAQNVGAGQAAIAADDHKTIDSVLDQVVRRPARGPRGCETRCCARCR